MRRRLLSIVCLLLTGSLAVAADPAAPSKDEVAANRAVGERLAQQAQLSLSTGSITPDGLRYSAALLESACKLDPTNSRNLRLLIEAYMQIGGNEGRDAAIKTLGRYLKLEPADLGAQLRMINLQFTKIEAADQQSKYIEQLLGTTALAPEVRAEVAVMGAKLAVDRLDMSLSKQYLERALELNPLSPAALSIKYQQMDPQAPVTERVALMLQVLRSNPAQPNVMADLAEAFASAGLVDPSQNWYAEEFKLSNRMGVPPDPTDGAAFVAELVIADQHRTAEPYVKGLMEQDPTLSDVAFLDLLIARRASAAERADAATQAVQKSLETRLSRISDILNDRQAPGQFDLTEDAKKLENSDRVDLTTAYASALADMAWLKIYFQEKPGDAQQYLTPLRQLFSPESITLARLDGWSFLIDGKKDEARVKLSAVAARDPLSALGMIRLDSADQPADKTLAQARQLLNANAGGLMGAMLIEALRDKVGLMPVGPDGEALRAELQKFDMKWLEILDINNARNFYQLKCDPLNVIHKYGEAMYATVTLTNSGKFDITIGPGATLKPDIWIDLKLTRPEQNVIPGVAFDRMTQRLILHPGETASQIVRVDTDGVVKVLANNPMVEIPLYYSILTNPMTTEAGVVPGPSGYRVQFTRALVRTANPLAADTMATLNGLLQNGAGDVKVRTLDLLGTYALLLKAINDPNAIAKSMEFADIVRKSTGDLNPAVRAQALLVTCFLSDPTIRPGIIQQMLSDASANVRMVGVAAVTAVSDTAKQKELIAQAAAGDADPLVKSLATAMIAKADEIPATQPSGGQPAAPSSTAGSSDGLGAPVIPVPAPADPSTPSGPRIPGQ